MDLKSHVNTRKQNPCAPSFHPSCHEEPEFNLGFYTNLLRDAHNRLSLLYSFADYTRDIRYIYRRISNEKLYFITTTLPLLMDGCLSYLEHGTCAFPTFKLQRGKQYPRFLKRIFAVVFEQHYTESQRSDALDVLYTISHAFKKLRGNPDTVLRQRQYDEFVKTDTEIGEIDILAPDIRDLLENIRSQWSVFAHDITLDSNCKPRPGPGAVVDKIPRSMRYAPHVLYKQLNDVFPYEDWFYSHPWDVNEKSRDFLALKRKEWPFSQYLQVPKTYAKWRGICKETNEAQYLQQGLRRLLNHHIRRKLANYLPLEDQSIHADYALQGSLDRNSATIDESEASDRILRSLVKYVSQDNTELCAALEAVSTRYIKPPHWATQKELLRTNKFAPMGSAVCFPVMSLLHLFAIRAIIKLRGHHTSAKEQDSSINSVSVYGDDIVLPSAHVRAVYEWLPRFGMKINQGKSFCQSFFRESCGCHAYHGRNITPVYIKYTTSSSATAKTLKSLLAVESQLYKKGFDHTACFLRKRIRTKWRMYLPYVLPTSPVLGFVRAETPAVSNEVLNTHGYKRKWNRELQCFQYRVPVMRTRIVKGILSDDMCAYLRWQLTHAKAKSSYVWKKERIISPFSSTEFVRVVDDETQDVTISWVYLPESAMQFALKDAI